MGWDQVDSQGGSKAPILKAGDCKTPTRIRLVVGPVARYTEPEQIFQHWGPDGQGFPPVACGDPSGNNCMFHAEPYAWRVSKVNVMNAIVYEKDDSASIKVLSAPASLLVQIRDQSRAVNVDPTTVDWIISRSGTGVQDTKYLAVMAPGAPKHGVSIDLSQWPAQESEFALEACPALIDFDKIDGFKIMNADEQSNWFDKVLENKEKKKDKANNKPGATTQAPPAPGPTSVPPAAPPTAAAPPPAPAPAAAAPPPAPAPQPNPVDVAKQLPSPWPDKGTMGQLQPHEIDFIIANETSFAAFPQQVSAAKIIKGGAVASPPAPAAAAAPPATNGAATGNYAALKERMGQILSSSPLLSDLSSARKYFLNLTGQKAIAKMTEEQLQLCVSTAEQGDAAIQAVISQA